MLLLLLTASLLLNMLAVSHSEAHSSATLCKTFPGLSKEQLKVCQHYPDVTASALTGLQIAVEECQYQLRWHRWNCSSLSTKNKNPHNSIILQKGYKETAFAHAISAAGVAHNVARACSSGRLLACSCESGSYHKGPQIFDNNGQRRLSGGSKSALEKVSKHRWKWSGCSHNLDFGVEFSQVFLDLREKAGDMQSRINLHNNEAGRLAVANSVQIRCKCHGYSGSCELKTCWKAAPDFRIVGDILKEKFRTAVLVDQSNNGRGPAILWEPSTKRQRRRKRPKQRRRRKKPRQPKELSLSLLYYQRSPSFCEKDVSVDFPGTVGRVCNKTSRGTDGCSSMCCGRGYNRVRERRIERQCHFHWCCEVTCQNNTIDGWTTVCK